MEKERVLKNIIVLQFGAFEDAYLASLIAIHSVGFSSKNEAIKDLAEDLLAKYKFRFMHTIFLNRCCEKYKNIKSNNFCRKCGQSLKTDFDILTFKCWIEDLIKYNYDLYGYDDVAGDRELLWSVGESPMNLVQADPKSIVSIEENAADVLIKSLGLRCS